MTLTECFHRLFPRWRRAPADNGLTARQIMMLERLRRNDQPFSFCAALEELGEETDPKLFPHLAHALTAHAYTMRMLADTRDELARAQDELSYTEDVLADTEKTLGRTCSWCGENPF